MSNNPDSEPAIPDFASLAADPEIAPLLRFDPVVRKVKRPDGWTPELQRELIARIAATGTVQAAVWQMGGKEEPDRSCPRSSSNSCSQSERIRLGRTSL